MFKIISKQKLLSYSMHYLSMAFNGYNYYFTQGYEEKYIIQLNKDLKFIKNIKTSRNYSYICFDKKENCFWAVNNNFHDRIYKLDENLYEIDKIYFNSDIERITGISCDDYNNCILLSTKNTIYSLIKSNKKSNIVPIKQFFGNSILGIMSFDSYIIVSLISRFKNQLIFAKINGDILDKYSVPNDITIKSILFVNSSSSNININILANEDKETSYFIKASIENPFHSSLETNYSDKPSVEEPEYYSDLKDKFNHKKPEHYNNAKDECNCREAEYYHHSKDECDCKEAECYHDLKDECDCKDLEYCYDPKDECDCKDLEYCYDPKDECDCRETECFHEPKDECNYKESECFNNSKDKCDCRESECFDNSKDECDCRESECFHNSKDECDCRESKCFHDLKDECDCRKFNDCLKHKDKCNCKICDCCLCKECDCCSNIKKDCDCELCKYCLEHENKCDCKECEYCSYLKDNCCCLKCKKCHCFCSNNILESIALVETSIAHILNAEGEKIQKILATTCSVKEILNVNKEVNKTIINLTHLEQVLYEKLIAYNEGLNTCCKYNNKFDILD